MAGSLFFLSLLGYALLAMALLPRLRMGLALLCAYCGMLFVSFYSIIVAGWMVPAAYGLMIGGLCCLPLALRVRRRLLSPALAMYVVLCALFILYARGRLIEDHDSLAFWARAVKELYTFDTFYIHADSTMFHMDYIPLQASLQYAIVRVFGWQDAALSYVTAACTAVCAAALSDLFDKGWMGALAGAALALGYRAFGFTSLDLRADGPMSLLFATGLITVYGRRDDDVTSLLPALMACSVLTGFKIFSGLMYAVLLALALLTQRRRALGLTSLALALLMHLSWSAVYNASMMLAKGQPLILGCLLAGNPRTGMLLHAFTPEKLSAFRSLAANTWTLYTQSRLDWMWLFWLPAVVLWFAAPQPKRRRALGLLGWLLAAAAVFVLGLLGSYFVQAETAPAAVTYLTTATTPLLLGALFLTAWLVVPLPAVPLLAAAAAGTLLLSSPSLPSLRTPEYSHAAALATGYYENEITLSPSDAGKHALLIDCSWEASQIGSQSAKTHAYAYFALPIRVEEPVYLPYGDASAFDELDGEALLNFIENGKAELLLLRVEDDLCWDVLSDALGLSWDDDLPIGVYDIQRGEDGCTFVLRED